MPFLMMSEAKAKEKPSGIKVLPVTGVGGTEGPDATLVNVPRLLSPPKKEFRESKK